MLGIDLANLQDGMRNLSPFRSAGRLRSSTGLLTCDMPAAVGDLCEIQVPNRPPVLAEVIGFSDRSAYLVSFDPTDELRTGLTVVQTGHSLAVPTGNGVLGRVFDGLGRPLDGGEPLTKCPLRPINGTGPLAMQRSRVRTPFVTRQRVIDGLLTCGQGQRVGIFAGSGVGKSTLLSEIARGSEADVNVIALIGERGREVRPFLEDCLGTDGLARSAVIVATCEQTPLMRVRSAQAAVAIADDFRSRGLNVLFMVDSLTRFAMAQREIGLALGEPPSARGYTPSVFQLLASFVERLGNAAQGGITALLTVLVDGDDMDEPISDAVRSMVDGHIVLDRKVAESGRYPAVEVNRSISRVAGDVADPEMLNAARKIRAVLQAHAEARDLIRLGAYVRGTSAVLDKVIDVMPEIERFVTQRIGERSDYATTRQEVLRIAALWPY